MNSKNHSIPGHRILSYTTRFVINKRLQMTFPRKNSDTRETARTSKNLLTIAARGDRIASENLFRFVEYIPFLSKPKNNPHTPSLPRFLTPLRHYCVSLHRISLALHNSSISYFIQALYNSWCITPHTRHAFVDRACVCVCVCVCVMCMTQRSY